MATTDQTVCVLYKYSLEGEIILQVDLDFELKEIQFLDKG